MQKIKLELDALAVETFETSAMESEQGTVLGHGKTDNIRQCGDGSIADACVTGLCTPNCEPTYSPDACPTVYPEYCVSADDACPSSRGCTEISC